MRRSKLVADGGWHDFSSMNALYLLVVSVHVCDGCLSWFYDMIDEDIDDDANDDDDDYGEENDTVNDR